MADRSELALATMGLVFLAEPARGAPRGARPVTTVGLGWGGVSETNVECEDSCGGSDWDVSGVAALIAGGVELGDKYGTLRLEFQVTPVIGTDGWGIALGPVGTVRFGFLEFGVGFATIGVKDDDPELERAGLLLRVGLGWPISSRWTPHASGEVAFGDEAASGFILASASRSYGSQ